MHGLRCAFQLHDYLSHRFYAYAFEHNTSAGIAILDGKVYVWNKNKNIGTIFAWGPGGVDSTGSRHSRVENCNASASSTITLLPFEFDSDYKIKGFMEV